MIITQDAILKLCKISYNQGLKPGVDFELDCLPLILKHMQDDGLQMSDDFEQWIRKNASRLNEDFAQIIKMETALARTNHVTKWLRAAYEHGKTGGSDVRN